MHILRLMLISLVAAALVFGAIGCGGGATPSPTATPAPTLTPTRAPTATPAPTSAPTPTATAAPTATPVATRTPGLTPTATPPATPTPSATAPAIQITKQTWKLTQGYAADSLRGLAAQKFADMVTEASNGQITVQVYPAATLIASSRDVEAVSSGAATVALTPAMVQTKIAQFFNILNMDGLWEGYDHQFRFLASDGWNTETSKVLAASGAKYLGSTPDMMGAWYALKREVKQPSDLKDMKLGAATGSSPSVASQYLGAKYVFIPSSEQVTAFQQGVIEGYASSASNFDALKIWEWAKYMFIFPDKAPAVTLVMMNPKTWDALPASFQETLTNKIVPAGKDI